MARRKLWELPSLHFEEELDEHRSVSWLELFFDLFFVVTIAQLTHSLSGHLSWMAVFEFVALFVPVWWVWVGFTYYNERFESNGLENRLFTFSIMLPVIGLAVFAHHGMKETFQGYVLSYAVARTILTILWLRAMINVPEFRPTGLRIVIGFGLSVILAFMAAFSMNPLCYIFFGFSLLLDLFTPLTTVKLQAKLPRLSSSKLPERFGLFVIIVLGEMVVGIVSGLAGVDQLSTHLFVDSVLGLAFGFGIWWIYFDFIARRPPKTGNWSMLWVYLHMPLVMSIAALGAGISNWIVGHHETLPASSQQLIASAVACALISMALLEYCLRPADDEPTHIHWSPLLKILGGVFALGLGWAFPIHDSFVMMILLLFTLFIQMAYGVWVWFTQDLEESDDGIEFVDA
jgi:low temperature requirement protein LtrA